MFPLLSFERKIKINTNIETKVESLIAEKIKKLGYELYDVEYVKEGKDYFLRIYIDSSKGISLDDCEKVSNSINDALDEADFIKEQYFLEVSSCGIEKNLRKDEHLKKSIGEGVQLKLFRPIDNNKTYIGILEDFNNLEIIIKTENEKKVFERKNISQIKTVYNW